MKLVDEFRNKKLVLACARRIFEKVGLQPMRIMEVCGTHTHNFRRFGLQELLPEHLQFISGPGCPVCVSDQAYIDTAIELAKRPKTIVTTFGDMLRVPGSISTLEIERSRGARFVRVRMLYSPLEALEVAKENPSSSVVFLGVGFETTAPAVALSILQAHKERVKNVSFYCALKRIIPAMEALMKDPRVAIDGFLCPGHVSAIIGADAYASLAKSKKVPCCVAGFEPLDIMEGILLLVEKIRRKETGVMNEYARVVTRAGNRRAQRILDTVFAQGHARWRGLGEIPRSGFSIRPKFARFDATKVFSLALPTTYNLRPTTCKCADVLKGILIPTQCPQFDTACRPHTPLGPCMVSSEGACNAYFRYRAS